MGKKEKIYMTKAQKIVLIFTLVFVSVGFDLSLIIVLQEVVHAFVIKNRDDFKEAFNDYINTDLGVYIAYEGTRNVYDSGGTYIDFDYLCKNKFGYGKNYYDVKHLTIGTTKNNIYIAQWIRYDKKYNVYVYDKKTDSIEYITCFDDINNPYRFYSSNPYEITLFPEGEKSQYSYLIDVQSCTYTRVDTPNPTKELDEGWEGECSLFNNGFSIVTKGETVSFLYEDIQDQKILELINAFKMTPRMYLTFEGNTYVSFYCFEYRSSLIIKYDKFNKGVDYQAFVSPPNDYFNPFDYFIPYWD